MIISTIAVILYLVNQIKIYHYDFPPRTLSVVARTISAVIYGIEIVVFVFRCAVLISNIVSFESQSDTDQIKKKQYTRLLFWISLICLGYILAFTTSIRFYKLLLFYFYFIFILFLFLFFIFIFILFFVLFLIEIILNDYFSIIYLKFDSRIDGNTKQIFVSYIYIVFWLWNYISGTSIHFQTKKKQIKNFHKFQKKHETLFEFSLKN